MAVAVFQRHDLPMVLPANLHALDADTLRRLLIAQDRELTLLPATRQSGRYAGLT